MTVSLVRNRAAIKTANWNFIGFTDVNPAATPGITARVAFAVDLPKGIWVEFSTSAADIAGQVVMVTDKGDDTVELLVMSDADEPAAYTLRDDDTVTVFVGSEGFTTGYAGKYLA